MCRRLPRAEPNHNLNFLALKTGTTVTSALFLQDSIKLNILCIEAQFFSLL